MHRIAIVCCAAAVWACRAPQAPEESAVPAPTAFGGPETAPARTAEGDVRERSDDHWGVGPLERARESGFTWLVTGQAEPPGFGQYSYLLLGAAPTLRTEDRYRRAVEALLEHAAPQPGGDASRLNITQIPVTAEPRGPFDANWVLKNYDYETARTLLGRLRDAHPTGPYIVSTERPLSDLQTAVGTRLEQNLSLCSPRWIRTWMRVFAEQTSQEEFWRADRLATLGTGLREGIARAAEEAQGAAIDLDDLSSWIRIIH